MRPGECFGLLGPNGAGKTTTLKMLLGITSPDSGAIRLVGEPVPARARFARERVGVVPQFDNLDPDFTVRENLTVFGRYFGLTGARMDALVPSLLEFARLESKADARVGELSGGMKRRLTLARALVNDPDVLVMDEPTTGLDPQARHMIWERLRSLLARGKTILLTTHFMEEAERLCDRLCVIEEGRKIAEGRPRELIESVIGSDVIEIYRARSAGARGGARTVRRAHGSERRNALLLCRRSAARACARERPRGRALSASSGESRRCFPASHGP